jgi:phenylacetate-CoA ligase
MLLTVDKMLSRASGLPLPISPEDLLNWQMASIRTSMKRAVAANGFYTERLSGVDIDSLTDFKSLEGVPFTYQEDIIASPNAFLCVPQRDVSRVTTLFTSGSTSDPKRIFFTEGDLKNTAEFFGAAIIPIMEGCGRVLIMMSDARPNSMASLLKSGVERDGVSAVIYGHVRDMDAAASAVREGDCIVGMPSEMLALARLHPELRPRSVLLSADFVPRAVLSTIREAWGARLYTHYGMTEICFACAVQHIENGVHRIRNERALIEVVDPETGRQCGFDEEGEIVITIFANEAMPLFRYRTGDISALTRDVSPTLPYGLSSVKGRVNNRIDTGKGVISIEELDEIIYAFKGVTSYEAELDLARGDLVLRIEPESGLSGMAESVKNKLAADLNVRVVKGVRGAARLKRNISVK